MTDREALEKQLLEQYENEYFNKNGFIMNSRQRKEMKKIIKKMIDKKLKEQF